MERASSDQFSNAISTKTKKKKERKRERKLHKIEYFILIINFIFTPAWSYVHVSVFEHLIRNVVVPDTPIYSLFPRASKYQKASQKHRVVNIDGQERQKTSFCRSQYSFSFFPSHLPLFIYEHSHPSKKGFVFSFNFNNLRLMTGEWRIVRIFIFDLYILQFIATNDTPTY